MKKTILSSLVLGALMAGNAMAADMRVKAPLMKAPPAPTFSWTGCYLDAGFGYGLWDQDHSTTFNTGFNAIENSGGGRGWLGRFGGGCDLQLTGTFSNFLIGAFGDYDAEDLNGSLSPLAFVGALPVVGDEKQSSAWAVGGRIGYALAPQIMTYVDGGWTELRFDQINQVNSAGASVGFALPAHTYNGWFLGGGFEYNFTWLPIPGLFWRTEYRYSETNRDDLANFVVATGLPDGNIIHSKKFEQTVTSSLVWRFNWFH